MHYFDYKQFKLYNYKMYLNFIKTIYHKCLVNYNKDSGDRKKF